MKVSNKKMTSRELRLRIASKGILGVAELATKIGCSRTVIYLAIETPARYPFVFKNILKVIA